MSVSWSSLPSLPLCCILDYLCVEDVIAALSTCRNWRNNVGIYHRRKDTLKLYAKNLERSAFLTCMCKKYVKALHIYVDCSQREFYHFMDVILPEFMDSQSLKELTIVGPAYIRQTTYKQIIKLKRELIERFLIKRSASLNRFAMLGCVMDKFNNEKASCVLQSENPSIFSSSLTYKEMSFPSDMILTRSNISKMMFSNIKHVILEYEYASTEALLTLTQLPQLAYLTLNVYHRRNLSFQAIEWRQVNLKKTIEVSVNIVGLPARKFEEVMDRVLTEHLALTSLKVMFCKTLNAMLVRHVCSLYSHTLLELVWVDAPRKLQCNHDSLRPNNLTFDPNSCNVNPFIFVCWQCHNLKRLVVHGYWVWTYDLVGMVRLRSSLSQLEVSAVRERCYSTEPVLPQCVLTHEAEEVVPKVFVQGINDLNKQIWSPMPWGKLHPGLRPDATARQRARYVVQEATIPLGVRLNEQRPEDST